jgi:hypothetical protein
LALFWLFNHWVSSLLRIRAQLATDAERSEAWLLRIRARILTFLVARYGEHSDPEPMNDPGGRFITGPVEREAYCAPGVERWIGGASAGPRRGKELSGPLRDIRRINAGKLPRWRWWV